MFNVQVDENVVKELCVEEIQKKVKEYDAELAFWDTKELKKTCMYVMEYNSGSVLL